jgi:hypothetical protein
MEVACYGFIGAPFWSVKIPSVGSVPEPKRRLAMTQLGKATLSRIMPRVNTKAEE